MRNILLALNANDVKTPCIDFASYIANLTKSTVTGIFLENIHKKQFIATLVSDSGSEEFKPVTFSNVKDNMKLFQNRCLHNYARYLMQYVKEFRQMK